MHEGAGQGSGQDRWGITDGFHDLEGVWHATSDDVRARLRAAMGDPAEHAHEPMWFVVAGSAPELQSTCRLMDDDCADHGAVDVLPADLSIGYHWLHPLDGGPRTRLVVHPPSCPEIVPGWGVSAQVYALWSAQSWGIGDLHDVRSLAERVVAAGGSYLMLSPLHQPAPTLPQEPSPYYPSSRRGRNPMLLGIDGTVPAHLRCGADRLIDHDEVWIAKRCVLESAFEATGQPPEPTELSWWNALRDIHRDDASSWPPDWADHLEDLRLDPDTLDRARFHEWLQLQIDAQLDRVRETGIGLIGDLAIGFAPGGADADAFRLQLAEGVRIGAPPDPFNAAGQNWGIPPLVPWRLRAAHYRPFIETVRAALRGMAGLRIDHVMGMFRQYWIPEESAVGAYVRFPAHELLAILAVEATRAGAFVIGEDLGTVEDGVREQLASSRIACTKVVWFEQDPPSRWPQAALATITTHDLPTIAMVSARPQADPDRQRLLAIAPSAGSDPAGDPETHIARVVGEAHRALLAAPSAVRLMTTDDLMGADRQPNVPGINDYPSWRVRLPLPVEDIVIPSG